MTEPLRLDVVLIIGERQILHTMSFDFRPGEVTALSGPSGSGKTTVLSIAGGLLATPPAGTASYGDLPMWQGDGDPRPQVAFVLQVYGLVPILSARENIAIALRARGVAPLEANEQADREAGPVPHRGPRGSAGRGCPADRCSGWPVPAASRCRQTSCWPTSRPASWTRATVSTS